jgi:hypothetical protein
MDVFLFVFGRVINVEAVQLLNATIHGVLLQIQSRTSHTENLLPVFVFLAL